MDALDLLLNRYSASNKSLDYPVPSKAQLDVMFQAAVTAPDHGNLKPWRFIVIEAESREALGQLLAQAVAERTEGELDEAMRAKHASKPFRAPLIIGVVACVDTVQKKVPELEQLLTAGIAAQHIQLAAQAQGFDSVWLSGDNCRARVVRDGLGIQVNEQLLGFLYIGTSTKALRQPKRMNPTDCVSVWVP